tara:strand:- start:274 stop:1062 length:789 start_codon:yes stop_codon:yes gene_type:complete
MKTNFFTKTFKPDIVNGDISNIIAADKTDKAFGGSDVLFDWQAIDIPRGACALVDTCVFMVGEDGGDQSNADFTLLFAKSVNGVAPTSIGTINAVPSGSYTLPKHIIGAAKMEGSANGIGQATTGHGTVYYSNIAGNNGNIMNCVLEGEPESGTNVGYDTIYVAAVCESGGLDFSTGVLADYSSGAPSADTTTSIVVKTVDARAAFQPDDIVYVHDNDTALGTVSSVTATGIVLAANNAVAVANEDELINATPITVTLKFMK